MLKEFFEKRMEDNIGVLMRLDVATREKALRSTILKKHNINFMSLLGRHKYYVSLYRNHYQYTFGVMPDIDDDVSSADFPAIWNMRTSTDEQWPSYSITLQTNIHLFKSSKHLEVLAKPNTKFEKRHWSLTWRKKAEEILWEQGHREKSYLRTMPQYWMDHYRGLPAQDKFRASVVNWAHNSGRYDNHIESFALSATMVPVASIVAPIKDPNERREVLERTRQLDGSPMLIKAEKPVLKEGDLLQTCFGLPVTGESNLKPCSTCPYSSACRKAAAMVERKIR